MRHPGHTSNRSRFIPGVRSERGEEAELPGGQQWLVIAAGTSSSRDRGLRKPAACLPACLYREKDGLLPTAKLEPPRYPRKR